LDTTPPMGDGCAETTWPMGGSDHLDTVGHLGFPYLATAVFVVGAGLALPSFRKR